MGSITALSASGLKKAQNLPKLSESLLPADPEDTLELDEMWTFVEKKENAKWIWIALSRCTRQVIAFHVGYRDQSEWIQLFEKIPDSYRELDTASDNWAPYQAVFPQHKHYIAGKQNRITNHVERFNNTLRQRLGRLTRKTLSFSKDSDYLK